MRAFYESGLEDAASCLGLTKVAFPAVGAALRGTASLLGRNAGSIAKSTGVGAGIGAVAQGGLEAYQADEGHRLDAFGHGAARGALAGAAVGAGTGALQAGGRNLAMKAERGIASSINRNLKPQAAGVAQALTKGVPRQIASDAAMGAGFGALMEGGMAANAAPEGEGAGAFAQGALGGAAKGFAAGGIMGLASRGTSNATGLGMKALAARPGMGGAAALKATQARGIGSTLRDVLQPARAGSAAPMGRGGAIAELGARATNTAGSWVLPSYITPAALVGGGAVAAAGEAAGGAAGEAATTPPQYKAAAARLSWLKTAKEHSKAGPDPVTLATMAGSGLGAGTTGLLGDFSEGLLANHPKKLMALRRFSTVPGAVAGAALGHYLGKTYLPTDIPYANVKPLSDLELAELRDYNPPRS